MFSFCTLSADTGGGGPGGKAYRTGSGIGVGCLGFFEGGGLFDSGCAVFLTGAGVGKGSVISRISEEGVGCDVVLTSGVRCTGGGGWLGGG